MTDVTRIVDLPENITLSIDPGKRSDGINTSYSPMDVHPNPYGHPPPSVPSIPTPSVNNENNTTSTLSHIQQQLPSRDIPKDQTIYTNDPEIQPNFIPPIPETAKHTSEYIKKYDEITEKKARDHIEQVNNKSRLDKIYDEVHIPFIIGLLFFIFHMPVVTSQLFKYLSFMNLYDIDGHFNTSGLVSQSILFSVSFYFLMKGVNFISEL